MNPNEPQSVNITSIQRSQPSRRDLGTDLFEKHSGGAQLVLEDVPAKELKPLVDSLKGQLSSGIVAVISVSDGKASLVVGVTHDLTERVSAVDLVRAGAAALGGKGGGGRPDMAQAGGPDGNAADAALTAIADAAANAA